MRLLKFLLILLLFNSCQSGDMIEMTLSDLPVHTPEELVRIDDLGDHYFSHIGYESVVLNDGSVLIPDRQGKAVYKVSATGEFLDTVLTEGNGPAEIQDITFMSESFDGTVLVYDQMTRKVTLLNSLGEYLTEFLISPWQSSNLTEIYDIGDGDYLMYYPSLDQLFTVGVDPQADLVIYNRNQDTYSLSKTIFGKPYARLVIDGAVRGGQAVPYSADNLRAYDASSGDVYLYRSDSNEIALIDESLDTLRTINIDIQPESLSESETDTLKKNTRPEMWDSIRELLPEYKAMADEILIDQNQNIWLKLNHKSEYQQWLVVSEVGENKAIVNLPKDVMLTHVSSHHLGLRMDAVTFALYEYPEGLN